MGKMWFLGGIITLRKKLFCRYGNDQIGPVLCVQKNQFTKLMGLVVLLVIVALFMEIGNPN